MQLAIIIGLILNLNNSPLDRIITIFGKAALLETIDSVHSSLLLLRIRISKHQELEAKIYVLAPLKPPHDFE